MTMFLSATELKELTGHVRSDAQVRELQHMGIEHRIRRDGTVAVLRNHCETIMSGTVGQKRKPKAEDKINWDALNAKTPA